MQTDGRITHVTLYLLLRCQGSDGIHDQNVDGTGTNQLVGNLQCLLTIVGL